MNAHSQINVRWVVLRAVVSGVLVAAAGIAPWVVSASLNVRFHPEVPWAAVFTALWLALLVAWLNGAGPPRASSELRRHRLRLWRPPPGAWSGENRLVIIGLILAMIALNVFRIAATPAQVSAELAQYPTSAFRISVFVMGAVVSGVAEEVAYRGWMQSELERIGPMFAITVSSAIFVLMHAVHGFVELLAVAPGFFIASVVYGVLALRSGSIVPGMVLHAAGDAGFSYFVLLGGDASLLLVR